MLDLFDTYIRVKVEVTKIFRVLIKQYNLSPTKLSQTNKSTRLFQAKKLTRLFQTNKSINMVMILCYIYFEHSHKNRISHRHTEKFSLLLVWLIFPATTYSTWITLLQLKQAYVSCIQYISNIFLKEIISIIHFIEACFYFLVLYSVEI